jgi:hypothetical protein
MKDIDLFIYFRSPLVGPDRWDIEEQLEDWLAERGEVTGGDSATDGGGGSIELQIFEPTANEWKEILSGTKDILKRCKVPRDTELVHFEAGKEKGRHSVYDKS